MYDNNQTHATDTKNGRPLAIQKRDNEPLRIVYKERYLRSYLRTESAKKKIQSVAKGRDGNDAVNRLFSKW